MNFDITELFPFKGSLVRFSGEPVQVLGHLSMITTFGNGENTKSIMGKYLIVNTISPYNIIIGRPSFNALEEALSVPHIEIPSEG